jgi:hypothetical protein
MNHPLDYLNGFGFDKLGQVDLQVPINDNLWWLAYTLRYGYNDMNILSMGSDRIQEWFPNGTLLQESFSIPACQYLHDETRLDGDLVWSLGRYSFPGEDGYIHNQLVDTAVVWKRGVNNTASMVFDYRMFVKLDDRTESSNSTVSDWDGCPVNGDIFNHTEDWTHGNSISRAEDGSGLLIASFRHLDAVIAVSGIDTNGNIDSDTGIRKAWQLGGLYSDFTFLNESDKFYHQHDAQILPNGNVLLFDNGNNRPEGEYSRGLELGLNFTTKTVRKVWEGKLQLYSDLYCFSYGGGSIQRLGNGNTLVQFPYCGLDNGYLGETFLMEFNSVGGIVAVYRSSIRDFADNRSRAIGVTIGGEIHISDSI